MLICHGKLFTSILCEGLELHVENLNLIINYQTRFRTGYSTLGNVFKFTCSYEYVISEQKETFLCFNRFQTDIRYYVEKWFLALTVE